MPINGKDEVSGSIPDVGSAFVAPRQLAGLTRRGVDREDPLHLHAMHGQEGRAACGPATDRPLGPLYEMATGSPQLGNFAAKGRR
jgi:hypothetical protein